MKTPPNDKLYLKAYLLRIISGMLYVFSMIALMLSVFALFADSMGFWNGILGTLSLGATGLVLEVIAGTAETTLKMEERQKSLQEAVIRSQDKDA